MNVPADPAYTMSDPADLINVALEALNNANIELPAFSTLDRWVSHERQIVHDKLYQQITSSLTPKHRHTLDELLVIPADDRMTGFSKLKLTPGPATLKHFRAWANRLSKLTALLDPKPCFKGIAFTKTRQFAAQASAHSIGDIRGVLTEPKRHTLLLSLLYQSQTGCEIPCPKTLRFLDL